MLSNQDDCRNDTPASTITRHTNGKLKGQHRHWANCAGLAIPLFALIVLLSSASTLFADEPEISFNRDIRPILAANCFACHGPDDADRHADLRLDTFAGATDSAIIPGDIDGSDLIDRITSDDPDLTMPPADSGKKRLSPAQTQLLSRWIKSGAKYDQHWALVPPAATTVPKVAIRFQNPIDNFVQHRLQGKELSISARASRSELARRVAMDLTGLPPSAERLQDFLEDSDQDAYEKFVRVLLAESTFGEHWASMWLDLARYADTDGYADDVPRTIWPYRDWVIDALNKDLPYDVFTVEQIAGDLLPDATQDQRIATGFNRNTMTNSEGGTIDEEYRIEAVKDRVDTTMQVWTGMTFGCAKCHTHKYDPITQDEYYQLFAIFNQSADSDLGGNPPFLTAYSRANRQQREEIQAKIDALQSTSGFENQEFQHAIAQWISTWHAPSNRWNPLPIDTASSEKGTQLAINQLGELTASGTNPPKDTYVLKSTIANADITAIQISAFPANSSQGNAKGVGRSDGNGNFVLSEVGMRVRAVGSNELHGKFVRIQMPGTEKMIHIAELQVMNQVDEQWQLVTQGATASQSSTGFGGEARLAIDGNTDGVFAKQSVTHTNVETDPWFELELSKVSAIQKIVIHNRTDSDLFRRHDGMIVKILDENRVTIWEQTVPTATREPLEFALDGWREIPFAFATASFEQGGDGPDGWHAGLMIDGDAGARGWAVSPNQGQNHKAILQLKDPLNSGTPLEVELRLAQNYGQQHTLANFSIQTTNQTGPNIVLPTAIAAAVEKLDADQSTQEKLDSLKADQPLWTSIQVTFAKSNPLGDALANHLAQLKQQLADIPSANTPIMEDLAADKHRTTRLLIKGSWLNPGHTVQASLPSALTQYTQAKSTSPSNPATPPSTPPSTPTINLTQPINRLTLANWLVDPDHPLVTRVAVNRIWARLFGRGLVETEEDFGVMGSTPSHPQLLDWLALDFVHQKKWSSKELIFSIVTSDTYRQSSTFTTQMKMADPENRLLSRSPRFRLSAEQVRDQALAIGGILNPTMYGPGVVPRLPVKEIGSAFSNRTITQSMGQDLYRRALYTYVRRTGPYPTMLTFDGTNRQVCTVRRIRTNTPLQALVTLNDPVFVEAAQGLARRILALSSDELEMEITKLDVAGIEVTGDRQSKNVDLNLDDDLNLTQPRLRKAFWLATLRYPTEQEVAALAKLLEAERAYFQQNLESATKLATDPLGPLPAGIPPAEAAAWTVVANVLLNLDEIMMR